MTTIRRRARTALLALALAAPPAGGAALAEDINALVWCDHTDPAFLDPFTEATGIRVNVRDYEGTGTGLALIEQSRPSDWDVFVVDTTDVRRVVERGLLAPLDPADFPLADVFPEVRLDDYHTVDGVLYAVPEKFGYNAIAFDSAKVPVEKARDIATLSDPAEAGELIIYDYYLPVISQLAIAMGKAPADLTKDDLPAIGEMLKTLRANAALVGDVVTSQTALATGQASILVGGGEYAVAGLQAEQPNLDWVLPDVGGLRWQQAVGVMAGSEKKEAATKFVQYILSPEGQARLATSSCYWGMPANAKAALTDEEKKRLRWDEQPGFLAKSYPYHSPTEEMDQAMQDLWAETIH
jgi:spermidine/putrescine transport system substrate-binding protein